MTILIALDLPSDVEMPIKEVPSLEESLEVLPEVLPIILDGPVEKFDPVNRAAMLSKSLARKWCGTYQSFDDGSTKDVTLQFEQVRSIGQIVDMRGDLMIGNISTPVQVHLNASSDQLELIPLSSNLPSGIEVGSVFMGLQGMSIASLTSPSFTNLGARLELNQICTKQISKAPSIRAIW